MAGAKKALATAAMVLSISMMGVQSARAAGSTLYEDDVHEETSEVCATSPRGLGLDLVSGFGVRVGFCRLLRRRLSCVID